MSELTGRCHQLDLAHSTHTWLSYRGPDWKHAKLELIIEPKPRGASNIVTVVCNQPVEVVEHLKYLSMIIDQTQSFNENSESIFSWSWRALVLVNTHLRWHTGAWLKAFYSLISLLDCLWSTKQAFQKTPWTQTPNGTLCICMRRQKAGQKLWYLTEVGWESVAGWLYYTLVYTSLCCLLWCCFIILWRWQLISVA